MSFPGRAEMIVQNPVQQTTISEGNDISVVTVASNVDSTGWDAFVLEHDEATGYHEWAWRGVFEGAFGHEPVILARPRGGRRRVRGCRARTSRRSRHDRG